MTKLGLYFEEEIGLALLFKLRGPLKAPENIVIVSIDRTSSEILHLPDDPEKWPRSYYAELIKKLNRQNPALIAFNLHFGETRDLDNDERLATAMAEHNNIILSNYLKQYSLPSANRQQQFRYERIIDPIPILDHAALSTAPFPLPKTSSTVKQFWAFKNSAGDIPTFPATVFQCFLFKKAYPEILHLLTRINPALVNHLPNHVDRLSKQSPVFQMFQKIKAGVTGNDASLKQFGQLVEQSYYSSEKKRLLHSWLALLQAPDSLYLNHYGNKETITTIPFYQASVVEILNSDLFKDKIVLVGYSENIEPEKGQGLYTVFSNSRGENISPIEIAATAVANLVDNSWIKPLSIKQQFFMILVWGLFIASSYRLLSFKGAISIISLSSTTYLVVAYYVFSMHYIWLPVCIPIMIQSPLVLMLASLSHFLKSKEDNRNIHKAFRFYLPDEVVNQVASQTYGGSMHQYGEIMQGVCMATDAGQYTTLSEVMTPQDMNVLMNSYYGVMFPQVTRHNGIISDVIGDAMLALWAKPVADIQCKINACQAALKIKSEVDHFNRSQNQQLPTRLGLHYGEMRLGNVGAMDHFEYRAIGDTVNTATRIEGLNKLLGTQILVSSSVIESLTGFCTRELGTFLLKGKTFPITIFELIEPGDKDWFRLVSTFAESYHLFQRDQWSEALESFITIGKNYPNDGPTQFYIRYLQKQMPYFQKNGPPIQAGIIDVGNITTLLH
ncbi:MAG: adenylate/guanylate cyclase domain-containing protein [Methylococcaceae bacterium]|nr:adenylate/guanylate cyclase domain-containing protein [Methylococcaceae bacterium]